MLNPVQRKLKRRKYKLMKSFYQSANILKGINPAYIPVFYLKRTNRHFTCQVMSLEDDKLTTRFGFDTYGFYASKMAEKRDILIKKIYDKKKEMLKVFIPGKCKFYLFHHSPRGHLLKIINSILTEWKHET